VGRQNEGSFGCEAVARALGQPNVPECGRVFLFLFCLFAANYYRCRFFSLPLTVGGTLRAPSVQGDFRIHPINLH